MDRERELLELAREPLLAGADERDELLRRLPVQLQAQLARALDAHSGAPRASGAAYSRTSPPAFSTALASCLSGLAAHDQHQHGVGRQARERGLERAELGRLPGVGVVDEQVAGAGGEA